MLVAAIVAAVAAIAGAAVQYSAAQEAKKSAEENAKRVKKNTQAAVESKQRDIQRYLASNEVSFFGSGIDVNTGEYDTVNYTYDAVRTAGARDIQNIKNTGSAQYESYLSQGRQAYLAGLGAIASGVGSAASSFASIYGSYGGGAAAGGYGSGSASPYFSNEKLNMRTGY